MFGHRVDGKRLKHLDPIIQITPYLMPMRCDAQVFLQHRVDYEKLACDPFLHKIYVWGKRAEDLQLRLKYAGIPENGIERVKEKKALLEAIGNSRVPVYILPNYTTMLSLWKTLKKQAIPS